MAETENPRARLYTKIIEKARADADFKGKLQADPKAAICEAFGSPLPESLEIEVLEETPSKLYLVLPVDLDDLELPDEMLEKAAGGGCCCWGD